MGGVFARNDGDNEAQGQETGGGGKNTQPGGW